MSAPNRITRADIVVVLRENITKQMNEDGHYCAEASRYRNSERVPLPNFLALDGDLNLEKLAESVLLEILRKFTL